jgi:hypothetical protein
VSTPESHPEKFPAASPEPLDPAALERLEKLQAPLPDAPLPDNLEERRKLVEGMFKGALACFFGPPAAETATEFEQEIDEHNRMVNEGGISHEPKKPTTEHKE